MAAVQPSGTTTCDTSLLPCGTLLGNVCFGSVADKSCFLIIKLAPSGRNHGVVQTPASAEIEPETRGLEPGGFLFEVGVGERVLAQPAACEAHAEGVFAGEQAQAAQFNVVARAV